MTRSQVASLAALAVLAGCAGGMHQADDSFQRTQQLARLGDPDAQLDLARMFADPAAWPQSRGMPPNPVLAAHWCAATEGEQPPRPETVARGPSCQQIMAALPPEAVTAGRLLHTERRLRPHFFADR